jgi:S1-C subfamily serine protease
MMKQIGRIVRPYLGVRYQIITNDYVQQNHLTVDHGALVVRGSLKNDTATSPGSPAEKAGIVEGDVILEVDGQVINEDHSLSAILGRYAPGETVTLKIFQNGLQKTIPVTLSELK